MFCKIKIVSCNATFQVRKEAHLDNNSSRYEIRSILKKSIPISKNKNRTDREDVEEVVKLFLGENTSESRVVQDVTFNL